MVDPPKELFGQWGQLEGGLKLFQITLTNGMCVFVPQIKTLAEMGFDESLVPPDKRQAFKTSSRAFPSMKSRFMAMSEADQRAVFANNKLFDFWKAEKFPLEAITVKRSGMFVPTSFREISGRIEQLGGVSFPRAEIGFEFTRIKSKADAVNTFWSEVDPVDRATKGRVLVREADLPVKFQQNSKFGLGEVERQKLSAEIVAKADDFIRFHAKGKEVPWYDWNEYARTLNLYRRVDVNGRVYYSIPKGTYRRLVEKSKILKPPKAIVVDPKTSAQVRAALRNHAKKVDNKIKALDKEIDELIKGFNKTKASFTNQSTGLLDLNKFKEFEKLEKRHWAKVTSLQVRRKKLFGLKKEGRSLLYENVGGMAEKTFKRFVDVFAQKGKALSPNFKVAVREAMDEIAKMIKPEIINEAFTFTALNPGVGITEVIGRAYYDAVHAIIVANKNVGTIVHEFGHYLEHRIPRFRQRVKTFFEKRTRNEKARWLGDSYGERELSKFDKFINPYMGKIYDDSSEILSMGLELFYRDPVLLATKDPEYFDFIWNLLRDF